MSDIIKQPVAQMTSNKPQSTINNQNSQDLQSQTLNPQSSIPDPDRGTDRTRAGLNPGIAISVRNLSKKYQLYKSGKHRLMEALHPFKKKYHHDFWALRDVSFEVSRGETMGIIGRNGAGKSTLLQIISGIMVPTLGEVKVNGRVSTLLALGAGFNPEFTGRENVYMNGIIMGLSRQEIDARFSDIISFADIGDFIDQPVKTYSSGMYVRLAFACAINVEPDILIVDEALAVGDAKFKNKCFQRFADFQKAGKTILFVTHEINAIVKHCSHAILLDKGSMIGIGKPMYVSNRYMDLLEGRTTPKQGSIPENTMKEQQKCERPHFKSKQSEFQKFLEEIPESDNCIYRSNYNKDEHRQDHIMGEIIDYFVICVNKYNPTLINSGDVVDFYLKAKFHKAVNSPHFRIVIKTGDGVVIYSFCTFLANVSFAPAKASEIIVFKFSMRLNLSPGHFFIELGIAEEFEKRKHRWLDKRCSLIHLVVQKRNEFLGLVDLETTYQEVSRKII